EVKPRWQPKLASATDQDESMARIRELMAELHGGLRSDARLDGVMEHKCGLIVEIIEAGLAALTATTVRLERDTTTDRPSRFAGPAGVRMALGALLLAGGLLIGLIGPGFLMALAGGMLLVMDVAGPQLRRTGLRLPAWLDAEDGRSHPVPSGRPIIVADTPSLVAVVSGAISAGDKLVQTLLDNESERAYNKPVDLDDEALLRQLQDLFAALEIGHGDYALGVARSLKVMVEARGIEIRAYDPEVARWFDVQHALGATKVQTLRPALVIGERVLLRGAVELPRSV
ncbi:MAG: hypothetical protein LC647_00765, partial [Beggiatoa sp.]|nr:hypothetical protein [Beggiatoa sp.]